MDFGFSRLNLLQTNFIVSRNNHQVDGVNGVFEPFLFSLVQRESIETSSQRRPASSILHARDSVQRAGLNNCNVSIIPPALQRHRHCDSVVYVYCLFFPNSTAQMNPLIRLQWTISKTPSPAVWSVIAGVTVFTFGYECRSLQVTQTLLERRKAVEYRTTLISFVTMDKAMADRI